MDDFSVWLYRAKMVLQQFTGDLKTDPSEVELVADLMRQASEQEGWSADNLLEKASTYVEVDLDEDRLELWVDICNEYLLADPEEEEEQLDEDELFFNLIEMAGTPEGAADLIEGVGLWDPEGDNYNLTSVKWLYSLDQPRQEAVLEMARANY
jgi:hypothetical protein